MSAALLAKLIEAGTPAELVGEVAMELARAQAVQDILNTRRAKDRERKALPRNSTESEESAENQDKGSLEVSPHTPLPKPSKSSPLNPPKIEEEKRAAIASCLHVAFPPPQGVTDEQWDCFCKQRKKKINQRSYALVTNKLCELEAQGYDPGDLIDLAIERGWETVFPPSQFGKPEPPKPKLRVVSPDEGKALAEDIARRLEAEGRHVEARQYRARCGLAA